MQSNRRGIVDGVVKGLAGLLKANGIQVVKGRGRFTGPNTLADQPCGLTSATCSLQSDDRYSAWTFVGSNGSRMATAVSACLASCAPARRSSPPRARGRAGMSPRPRARQLPSCTAPDR